MTSQGQEELWRWTRIASLENQMQILGAQWPFSGRATDITIKDHSALPFFFTEEWRSNHCIHTMNSSKCDEIQTEDASTIMLCDCKICLATYCQSCYSTLHSDRGKRRGEIKTAWHLACTRNCNDKVVANERRLQAVLAADIEILVTEMNWFKMRLQNNMNMLGGVMNIYWMADLASSIMMASITHTAVSGSMLTTVSPIIAASVAVVASVAWTYHAWSIGRLGAKEFWKNIGKTWVTAAGAVAGGWAGAMAGAAVGACFCGVGSILGAAVGGAVGSVMGAIATKSAFEALLDWIDGIPDDAEEALGHATICEAMRDLGLHRDFPDLNALTKSSVRKTFRELALMYHPDKTGLVAKDELTEEEKKVLFAATQKFQTIQHNVEVVEAYLETRDTWGKSKSKRLEKMYINLAKEWANIERKSEKEYKHAMESAVGAARLRG